MPRKVWRRVGRESSLGKKKLYHIQILGYVTNTAGKNSPLYDQTMPDE